MKTIEDSLAFCSWSTQPKCPNCLTANAQAIGISRVQLHLNPIFEQPDDWADAGRKLADAGVTIVSGMFTPKGEDYSTPATIRETGGVVPDHTWQDNLVAFHETARVAKALSLPAVSFHAGFIPEDDAEVHDKLVERLQQLGDILKDTAGADLLLETGQETAESLDRFLSAVDRDNVAVNFDPANMILYGMGDPIAAVAKLLPRIRQAHIKDATAPPSPGEWGAEVAVGTGEVNWEAFFKTLKQGGYQGDLVIEREAGDDRIGDIKQAAAYVPQFMG
ncbi:MAG: sugar phosphate isomerase/epimerase family protein [Phycisphaeraceae bacterium]